MSSFSVIQQKLENPLAKKILAGDIKDGDAIKIDADRHTFKFEKAEKVVI